MKKYYILLENDEVKLVSQKYNHIRKIKKDKNKSYKMYQLKFLDNFITPRLKDYFSKDFWLKGIKEIELSYEIETPDFLKNKERTYTFSYKSRG